VQYNLKNCHKCPRATYTLLASYGAEKIAIAVKYAFPAYLCYQVYIMGQNHNGAYGVTPC